jgi:hypothetical protein
MTAPETAVIGGIDTHTDVHQAAVIDSVGRHLDTQPFETNSAGYEQLLAWLRAQGEIIAVGMEGTGAYGAELARFLTASGITVVEVDRPDRKPGGPTASPTRSTPTRRPPQSCPVARAELRRAGTESWKRSARCV